MIAALFVAAGGTYYGLPGVDPWDESRDARLYDGPHAVVAHPPCSRWCQLAPIIEARYGYKVGDDGGCFSSALRSVRRFGGVLEHPAETRAWRAFSLHRPMLGRWKGNPVVGWTCEVTGRAYGHPAIKRTWLYAYGFRGDPPSMRWERGPRPTHTVSRLHNHWDSGLPKLSPKMASATTVELRDALLRVAGAAAAEGGR